MKTQIRNRTIDLRRHMRRCECKIFCRVVLTRAMSFHSCKVVKRVKSVYAMQLSLPFVSYILQYKLIVSCDAQSGSLVDVHPICGDIVSNKSITSLSTLNPCMKSFTCKVASIILIWFDVPLHLNFLEERKYLKHYHWYEYKTRAFEYIESLILWVLSSDKLLSEGKYTFKLVKCIKLWFSCCWRFAWLILTRRRFSTLEDGQMARDRVSVSQTCRL